MAPQRGLLAIPGQLTDITIDWVSELLYSVLNVPRPSQTAGTHNGITLLQIRARRGDAGLRESCQIVTKCSAQPDKVHRLLVEIVPSDPELRELIMKHRLFAKEITIYEEVLPALRGYVKSRSSEEHSMDVTFSVPNYLYGDVDEAQGRGIIIFEDFGENSYHLEDPVLMLLSPEHVSEVVISLATFHAICTAYGITEDTSLEARFPLLAPENGACTWFQDDMTDFLHDMYATCYNFLQSIPGQAELCQWFARKMSQPERLHSAGQMRASKLRSIVHGDLWHNNLFFNQSLRSPDKPTPQALIMTDWQMCHIGMPTNDLCFLLFSSTTPNFRKEHWDSTLHLYYNTFMSTVRSLSIDEDRLSISFEDFQEDVRASIPISLFFCGNIQDLELSSEATLARENSLDEDSSVGDPDPVEETLKRLHNCMDFLDEKAIAGPNTNADMPDTAAPVHMVMLPRKSLTKVPTIASENDLVGLDCSRKRSEMRLDPRKARAMRRKMYLELYKEAADKGLI